MNILVTGGSRGIGKAIAKALVQDGHKVLITGRDHSSLEQAVKEIGGAIDAFPMDVTKPEDTARLAKKLEEQFSPDGLVLSAAMFSSPETKTSVLEPSADELSRILDANVTANYRMVQKLLPLLSESGRGRIVLIGSTAGIRQDKGGIYGISKWALRGYAGNLREECKAYGIGVSLINPGGTFTERRRRQSEHDRRLLESSDLGILVAALFRMSPQAVLERADIRPITGDTY